MRSPHHFSFKNFSGRKRKSISFFKLMIWVMLLMIGVGIFFFFWDREKLGGEEPAIAQSVGCVSATKEKPLSSVTEEAYVPFDKGSEQSGLEVADMEEQPQGVNVNGEDSELVVMFRAQEKRESDSFDQDPWRQHSQKPAKASLDKTWVAVVMEGSENLSAAEWRSLQKLKVPITFVFPAHHPQASSLAQKAWKGGREVLIKGEKKGNGFEKKIPHMMGVVAANFPTIPSLDGLVVSPLRGLMEGIPHAVFSFPLLKKKKAFYKSKRTILWVKATSGHLSAFVVWVQQNHKKVVFVPLSQLYAEKRSRGITKINITKVQESRPNLV